MNGKEIFMNTPILTEENCEQILPYDNGGGKEYFEDLNACVEVLKKKYKDTVTGLWYIRVPAEDGGTQFVFRVKKEIKDVYIRNRLHADIFDFTSHEMCYYITDDSTHDLDCIPIEEWIEDGMIYTLYDSERSVG